MVGSRYKIDVPILSIQLIDETLSHHYHCCFNIVLGLKSLWSQIGGFIGIFLGYGLMQVIRNDQELTIFQR